MSIERIVDRNNIKFILTLAYEVVDPPPFTRTAVEHRWPIDPVGWELAGRKIDDCVVVYVAEDLMQLVQSLFFSLADLISINTFEESNEDILRRLARSTCWSTPRIWKRLDPEVPQYDHPRVASLAPFWQSVVTGDFDAVHQPLCHSAHAHIYRTDMCHGTSRLSYQWPIG
jgi:hypothetical protein